MLAPLRNDTIKTVGAAHVYLAVKGHDGMHLAQEAVLGQEVTIDRRYFNREDAVRRGAPEHAMTIIDHIGHLIGTQAVSLSDGIQVMTMVVGNHQTVVLPDLDL